MATYKWFKSSGTLPSTMKYRERPKPEKSEVLTNTAKFLGGAHNLVQSGDKHKQARLLKSGLLTDEYAVKFKTPDSLITQYDRLFVNTPSRAEGMVQGPF